MQIFKRLSILSSRKLDVGASGHTVAGPGSVTHPELELEGLAEMAESTETVTKDPFFYYDPLIILVQATLFKFPRTYLENHSDVFWAKYLLLPKGQMLLEGSTDENPLRLDGIDAAEFACLAKVLNHHGPEEVDLCWMEWISVLKFSLMWKMQTIEGLALKMMPNKIVTTEGWIATLRFATEFGSQGLKDLAIQKLANSLSPSMKVVLAFECKVTPWLLEGYTELVNRPQGPSDEERELLKEERTIALYRMRSDRLEGKSGRSVEENIREAFKREFTNTPLLNRSPVSYLQTELRTATDLEVVRRDEKYYLDDIIFLVEGTLFRVPRYLFEETSEIFRDMYALPVAEGVEPDGSSDEQPLTLEGVRKADFRLLLKAMGLPAAIATRAKGAELPESTSNVTQFFTVFEERKAPDVEEPIETEMPRKARKSKATKTQAEKTTVSSVPYIYRERPVHWKEWASVLLLSSMWQMSKLREMAVKNILEHPELHISKAVPILEQLPVSAEPVTEAAAPVAVETPAAAEAAPVSRLESTLKYDWMGLLNFSTNLGVIEVRDPVISKLSQYLLPSEKVDLGIKCGVPAWIQQGYLELVVKEGGITTEDEEKLGQETTLKLFQIRELFFLQGGSVQRWNTPGILQEIKRVFAEELRTK